MIAGLGYSVLRVTVTAVKQKTPAASPLRETASVACDATPNYFAAVFWPVEMNL